MVSYKVKHELYYRLNSRKIQVLKNAFKFNPTIELFHILFLIISEFFAVWFFEFHFVQPKLSYLYTILFSGTGCIRNTVLWICSKLMIQST